MNFLELQKTVQEYIADTSSTTLEAIKDEINGAIDEIMNKGLWRFAMRQTTITTSSGIADYYFPADFGRVVSFTQRDDDIQLQRVFISNFEAVVPDPTAAGNSRPKCYMELLDERVLAQPTTAALVTLVSDSNSDLTQKATIWGVVGGVDRRELVSLSAQNFVSSTNSYSKLYGITLDVSCAGTIAAYEATAATSLVKLYPGEIERNYKAYKLYPTPDAAYTLYLTYQAQAPDLINDSDVPIIPSRYHGMIPDMVIARRLLKQGDQKANYFFSSVKKSIEEMSQSEDYMYDYNPCVTLAPNIGTVVNPVTNPLVNWY
jgi:hypothetical protein